MGQQVKPLELPPSGVLQLWYLHGLGDHEIHMPSNRCCISESWHVLRVELTYLMHGTIGDLASLRAEMTDLMEGRGQKAVDAVAVQIRHLEGAPAKPSGCRVLLQQCSTLRCLQSRIAEHLRGNWDTPHCAQHSAALCTISHDGL